MLTWLITLNTYNTYQQYVYIYIYIYVLIYVRVCSQSLNETSGTGKEMLVACKTDASEAAQKVGSVKEPSLSLSLSLSLYVLYVYIYE